MSLRQVQEDTAQRQEEREYNLPKFIKKLQSGSKADEEQSEGQSILISFVSVFYASLSKETQGNTLRAMTIRPQPGPVSVNFL